MSLSRRQFALASLCLPLVIASARRAEAATHQVSIKNMKFSPAALTVAPGDQITFTNEDGAPHTATATDGSFDTGRLAKGESATITAPAAGEYAYICAVHPMMKGTLTVG